MNHYAYYTSKYMCLVKFRFLNLLLFFCVSRIVKDPVSRTWQMNKYRLNPHFLYKQTVLIRVVRWRHRLDGQTLVSNIIVKYLSYLLHACDSDASRIYFFRCVD